MLGPTNGRVVICIGDDGARRSFRSVNHAAVELQLSKSSVRKACKTGSQISGLLFKYQGDPEPATSITVAKKQQQQEQQQTPFGKSLWNVAASLVPGREGEVALHCVEFGAGRPVTTLRVHNGAMNLDQMCIATGTTLQKVLGQAVFHRVMHQIVDAGADREAIETGLFMQPFHAAAFAQRLSHPMMACFVESIAAHYSCGQLEAAFFEHFETDKSTEPMYFQINRVEEL